MLEEKEPTDVVQQFGRTYRAFMTAFENYVNVPMPRWRIMLTLRDWTSAQPQKKLVEALGMDPGALTRQVQQLEVAGWIARSVDERDNRLTNVMLTDAGRMEIERAMPACEQFRAATMEAISPESVRTMSAILAEIDERLAAVKHRPTSATNLEASRDAAPREASDAHGVPTSFDAGVRE